MSDEKEPVRFHLTSDQMMNVELGTLLDIEDNPSNIRQIAAFMQQFVVDAEGKPLPPDEAKAAIRRVTLGQLQAAFKDVIAGVQETAAPNG